MSTASKTEVTAIKLNSVEEAENFFAFIEAKLAEMGIEVNSNAPLDEKITEFSDLSVQFGTPMAFDLAPEVLEKLEANF